MRVHGISGVVLMPNIRDIRSQLTGLVLMILIRFTGELWQTLIMTRSQKTRSDHTMVGG